MIAKSARFVLVIIFSLFLSLSFSARALAQEPQANPSSQFLGNTNSDVPQDIRTVVQVVTIELLGSFSCQLTGYNAMNPSNGGRCLGVDPATGKIGYVQSSGGLVGTLAGGIIATYSIPVSSSHYVAYTAHNFGISQTYAQYTGFQTLAPLLKIWKVFRDLVYLLFVVAFILIGLGIMFRLQIDARTVMTIQNQIPKVIIALLLVTFSYAIAGILVDLMWVSIYLIIAVMTNGTGITADVAGLTNPQNLFQMPLQYGDRILKSNPNSISGTVDVANSVGIGGQKIISELFDIKNWNTPFFNANAGCYWWDPGKCVANQIGEIVPRMLGLLVNALAFGAIFLIAAVTLVITFIRIWFTLIKAYVYILLDVVLAPFWIISGLLPGGGGVGPWLRDLLANLSAFPVVIMIFLLGRIFIDNFAASSSATHFIPPLIGYPGNPDALAGLIGFAIVLITPEALNITRETLKAPDFKYAATIGKAVGAGQGAAFAFPGSIWKYAWKKNAYGEAKGPLAVWLGNTLAKRAPTLGRAISGDWSKGKT